MKNFIAGVLLVFSLLAHAQDALIPVAKGHDASSAIVLVGGITSDYHSFDNYLSALVQSNAAVYGFDHDHRTSVMDEGAAKLQVQLETLQKQGVRHLTLIAHSMGGLVAKRALHRMEKANTLAGFDNITLEAYGTPWGGFAKLNFTQVIPFSGAIAWAIGFPMGVEIATASPFMAELEKPLPSNVTFKVIEGDVDVVATPDTPDSKRRYAAITANAVSRDTWKNVGHDDFFHGKFLVAQQ